VTRIEKFLLLLACVCALLSLFIYPLNSNGDGIATSPALQVFCGLALLVVAVGYALEDTLVRHRLLAGITICAISLFGAWALLQWLTVLTESNAAATAAGTTADTTADTAAGPGFWTAAIAAWALGWLGVEQLAAVATRSQILQWILRVVIPIVFGAWLLIIWELVTRGFSVPQVLLPSPSAIAERFENSTATLWVDFKQTFLKAVLIGYAIGCLSGFLVALLIDKSPFLKRGLLPVGNLVSALPIIGVAPIMVMWFGFDWPSKAAVVVVMTFFPMLVNTVAGLSAADQMQGDLMKTYAASYSQSLVKLRLPQALPFIFNALKINSTLALIGAIVAEFFGTPIVGMGFRISTEVGRMNVDMVWAEIAVAAIAGSLFYGLITLIERMCTFWHPSFR
jgi:NitT/TauT family transport system permease protein